MLIQMKLTKRRKGHSSKLIMLFLLCVYIALLLSFRIDTAYAQEIVAEGTYIMGDGETPSIAEERALLQAKRMAVEKAGTYVQSFSKTKNFQLKEDEVQVVASGMLTDTVILEKKRTWEGNAGHFWVKIQTNVNMDKMEEAIKTLKDKSFVEDYKKLQQDYNRLQKDIESLQTQLLSVQVIQEKRVIESQITENEKQFQITKLYDEAYGYAHRSYEKGNTEKALDGFNKVIELAPEHVDSFYQRGQLYSYSLRLPEKAIADFTKAINLRPQETKYYLSRANEYKKIHEYGKAILDCNKAIELQPESAKPYLERGEIYLEQQLYDQSISDFTKALSMQLRQYNSNKKLLSFTKNTSDYLQITSLYRKRSEAYSAKGLLDSAMLDVEQLLVISPDHYYYYVMRGIIYKKKGMYDLALSDFEKSINLVEKLSIPELGNGLRNIELIKILENRASLYEERRLYDQAISDYNEILKVDSQNANAYNYRGWAYHLKGDNYQALQDYNKALSIDPEYAWAYNRRGLLHIDLKQFDKAIMDFNKAIVFDSKYDHAYRNRGDVYREIGLYDQAIRDYTKAVEINPQYADAYFGRGNVYFDQKKYNLAIADYDKAITISTDFAAAYFNKALASDMVGRFSDAIISYKMALKYAQPGDSWIINARNRIRELDGNVE